MSKNGKIIIILVAVLLAIAAIIILLLSRGAKEEPEILNTPVNANTPLNSESAGKPEIIITNSELNSAENKEEDALFSNLSKMAASFAERFGSFSNQEANYKNIKDLQVLMTDSMKNWSEDFIRKSLLSSADNSVYFGITTKALSTEILNLDATAGTAEIMVETQRQESIGNTLNSDVYYEDIKIAMKRVNGDLWKVDGAYWQEKK